MKNAILVHGYVRLSEANDPTYPTPSNNHWFPWLSKKLMMQDIHTVSVEMPKADLPTYVEWKKEFERYDVGAETILVGHSCGGGFLVRWLSENTEVSVDTLVLVAPSSGLNWPDKTFFDFEIDEGLKNRIKKTVILVAEDDKEAILEAVKIYEEKLGNAKTIRLQKGGHLTLNDMKTDEFPELLEAILE